MGSYGTRAMLQKRNLRKVWHFIWEDNSMFSWGVNVLLAFILIKFLVYPGLGFALSTSHPVVAVISESMEHETGDFDTWWAESGSFYPGHGIDAEKFKQFRFSNGFNEGDMMVVKGKKLDTIEKGDVLVFIDNPEPIIHRVVDIKSENGKFYFSTKGDNNDNFIGNNEIDIAEDRIIGEAWIRIPYLGWVKIMFVRSLQTASCVIEGKDIKVECLNIIKGT